MTLWLWLWLHTAPLAAAPADLPVVAVDAGHGGSQEGAVGICGAVEKDVALAIARLVATILDTSGRATALLTRSSDATLSLEERAHTANRHGAALFVSIHANASSNPTVRGVETFFLSSHAANTRARQRPQAADPLRDTQDLGAASAPTEPAATPPRASEPAPDTLGLMLHSLQLNAAHHASQRLAMRLHRALQRRFTAHGRGVLQAPFVVLHGAQMAAALVEVGFLSNPQECARLAAPAHQQIIAEALAAAILAHIASDEALTAQR